MEQIIREFQIYIVPGGWMVKIQYFRLLFAYHIYNETMVFKNVIFEVLT